VVFECEEVPEWPEHSESTTVTSRSLARSVSQSAAPGDEIERRPVKAEKKTSTRRGRKGKAPKQEPSTEELLGEELMTPDAEGAMLRKRPLSDVSISATGTCLSHEAKGSRGNWDLILLSGDLTFCIKNPGKHSCKLLLNR
jgi:hypothetical protein